MTIGVTCAVSRRPRAHGSAAFDRIMATHDRG